MQYIYKSITCKKKVYLSQIQPIQKKKTEKEKTNC